MNEPTTNFYIRTLISSYLHPKSAKLMMKAAFHHRFLFVCRPHDPPSTASKLFPPSTAPTHRSRCIHRPSATTTNPHNHHDSAPSAAAAAAALHDYRLLFSSQPAESTEPLPLLATEGALPADFPLGTYYLVGPGMIADSHGSTVSPLDGHGYLRAFRFIGGGAVMYSARYVETEAVREEREAETGKWQFRRPGLFSVFKSGWTNPNSNLLKNVANTTVLSWGKRLFCLWEGGHPYELEPTSLATIGLADLFAMTEGRHVEDEGGVLNQDAGITKPLLYVMLGKPPKRTLSHFKIDAQRNRLLLLCCDTEDLFLPQANFTFYEFDSNFELKQKKKYRIPDQVLIHDWAFTDSHYIIMGNRVKIDVPGTFLAIAGLAPTISTISLNPSQPTTPIYLFPRYSKDKIPIRDWRIPIEAPSQLWISHMGNAYEEKDGAGNMEIKMQASVCSYQWFDYSKIFGYDAQSSKLDPSFMNLGQEGLPHLVQISIELDAARGSCLRCSIADSSNHWKRSADFPVINPTNSGKPNRFMYASSTSGCSEFLPHFPFDTVMKLDCSNGSVKSWSTESRMFTGEPMFISKGTKDEDDGYVVVIEYAVSRQKCYLVVLDARKIGDDDAVVVKLQVPEHLSFPIGFHGFWDGK